MNLLELRDSIVTGLKADPRLAGADVSAHGGDFRLNSLKRYAERAPCVKVAVMRNTIEREGGDAVAVVRFIAVCITKDENSGGRRHAQCLQLVDAVSRSLAFDGWFADLPGISLPVNITGSNYFAEGIDREGIAMWGVAWEQKVDLLDTPPEGGYVDFLHLHVDYDVSPRDNDAELGDVIEAQDDIELEPT